MSGFKRNSSRFGRGGGSNSGSERGESRSSGRSSGGSSRGSSRGGSSRGEGRSGGGQKSNFFRLGGITISKSTSDDAYDWAMENLRGNEELKLNVKVYLGKEVDEMALRNGDILTLSFRVSDKDKDFVIGHLLTPAS